MTSPRFGSRKFGRKVSTQPQEVLPERKIVSIRDFRRGYIPSEQRQMVPAEASPRTHDFEVRTDNRLQRAPGTLAQLSFGTRQPYRMFLHPTLNSLVDLGLVAPPEIGFRNTAGVVQWTNIGMADRPGEFAYTVFGGTLIFTDGINVWYRETSGSPVEPLPEAPMARSYASFAARVMAGGAIIDGQFEPLGVRWSAANSNFTDWDGIGSGFELLVNDTSVGDRIVSLLPMNLDTMAVVMRQSIWIGRFTGQALRPVDFSVRVPGVGAVNSRVSVVTHFGVVFLNDFGVYLFDGNTVELLSESIHPRLLPLDYDNIEMYHATYDPVKKRYILFTPSEYWQFELEHNRWFRRRFTTMDSLMFPMQIDGVRWFEAVGQWLEQGELIWLDFAGKNLGELRLWMLADEEFDYVGVERAIGEESYRSGAYFGECMHPYWESKLFDEQDASKLVTSMKQLIEFQGQGRICVLLPNEDNQYEQVAEVEFEERDYPSLAVLNAEKVGKGTGIAICVLLDCQLEEAPGEPQFPDYDYDEPGPGDYDYDDDFPEVEWPGFQVFTDVASCTPPDDGQQFAAAEVACFVWCDQPICGGLGGWLIWYSNDPAEIAAGCDHPNNPIPGMLS